jgi:hypothetical protein
MFYNHETKGSNEKPFRGIKKSLSWLNNYLIVVTNSGRDHDGDAVTLYDMQNKLLAYSSRAQFSIEHVVVHWGFVFLVTRDHKMYQLTERDLSSKLEHLYKKHVYQQAIELAQNAECDSTFLMEIKQMYGDHLYNKHDFDQAIAQYRQTIGFCEPSYVIRKFLDAQRIHNLTDYLEELHEQGVANEDHTTLLLNCYTKLREHSKLDAFVRRDDLNFDVTTAITVCREAQYYEHALFLAKKHGQHGLYLKIQLEDASNFDDALAYICSLEFNHAKQFALLYGLKLLRHGADQTTALFSALCTDYQPTPLDGLEHKAAARTTNSKAHAEDFVHFFVGFPRQLERFLETVRAETKLSVDLLNTLLELYLTQTLSQTTDGKAETKREMRSNPYQAKTIRLLKDDPKPDMAHALVLTKMYDFEPGTLYLYGELKLYEQYVLHHIERDNPALVIAACKKFQDHDRSLWVQALTYLAAKPDPSDEHIAEVLEKVKDHNLLPPLQVIQMLADKPLSVVREYIIDILNQENETIATDEGTILHLQEQTKSMRSEIEASRTRPKFFKGNQCRADGCMHPLTLPAVHFLCGDSFHQRCVGDDTQCPKCAPEYTKVTRRKEQLKQSALQNDRFFRLLEESPDGFKEVAEYFGRGLFEESKKTQ